MASTKFLDRSFYYLDSLVESPSEKPVDLNGHADISDSLMITLEKLTQIKAEIVYRYASGRMVDQEIILKWKDWVEENRALIRWDFTRKTINRLDFDIWEPGLLTTRIGADCEQQWPCLMLFSLFKSQVKLSLLNLYQSSVNCDEKGQAQCMA